jgi:hypothetical protein
MSRGNKHELLGIATWKVEKIEKERKGRRIN